MRAHMGNRIQTCLLLILLLILVWPTPALAESGGPFQPLIHTVQRGETTFSIARRYGTTVDAITHANGIADPRRIYAGQQLLIPNGMAPVDAWSTHVVRPGETLTAISAQHGVSWRGLASANRLVNPHLLYVGQVLHLPDPVSIAGALHALQPGETFLEIAFQRGTSFWDLAEANAMENPALALPGRWVLVPGDQPSWMPLPFTSVELSPLPVQQGQAMIIAVRTAEPATIEGTLFDRPLLFVQEAGAYYAVAGIHTFTEPGLYEMTLSAVDGSGQRVSMTSGVVVMEGAYGYERIDLPPSRANLLDPAIVAAEEQRVEEVRGTFTPTRVWHSPFERPVEAPISSYFGTRRSYNGSPYSSYHGGVDFSTGRGTPVRAPADGTVVLAEALTVRGNAVVLDHGWGVLTGYWHLSSIAVTPGQQVRSGDVIGHVGNTGLSTGAHLHWEVWAGGVSVDALQWLSASYPWAALDAASAR